MRNPKLIARLFISKPPGPAVHGEAGLACPDIITWCPEVVDGEPVERLCGLVTDESNNHAVEVEEEHEQVEGELDEGFLSRGG